ncbi:MAG: hypothetical protein KC983_05920 [Phycisphaerales bacterium]|nr:hypothetical protein [Phycisphaerales bacterium]
MPRSFRAACPLILCLCALVSISATALKPVGRPGELVTIEQPFGAGVIDGYNLYLPISYADSEKSYPILLFLQGSAGVGGTVRDIANWGVPRALKEDRDMTSERNQLLLDEFIVVAPHLTAGRAQDRQYYDQAEAIDTILRSVLATYRADAQRVYATGLSRGGTGTWGLAVRLPGRFAAIVPIGGELDVADENNILHDLPMWIAHNRHDDVAPFEPIEALTRDIEAAGGTPFYRLTEHIPPCPCYLKCARILTSVDTEEHDAWTRLYDHPQVFRWMLKQKRPSNA